MKRMGIGAVAKQTGISSDAIRYYERCGILPILPRSEGRYRLFSQEDIRRIRFTKRAQDLGFSLDEIRDLLSLSAESPQHCQAVRLKALARREMLHARVRDLTSMLVSLDELIARCEGEEPGGSPCPMTASLAREQQEES